MSTEFPAAPRPLPERPNLRHLKDQAKDLLRDGRASSLADAQLQVARLYGFPSWPKLKARVELFADSGLLKLAIDRNDLHAVKELMTRNPALHRAPMGYKDNGPLTWVAECRIPREPPAAVRLAIAELMIANGSDVHQGGDGPLMRAALSGERIPMMELLVAHGADVNAEWSGRFPILFAPCETVDPASLRWLLAHGAHPDCAKPGRQTTALDYVIGSYVRTPALKECIELLVEAGGTTRFDEPGVLDILCGRLDRLRRTLDANPELVHQRYPQLDCGSTGSRRLTLVGATLLHLSAEFGNVDAVTLLLERGADMNAAALIDENGVGGQTPIFHAVTQPAREPGLTVTRLLIEHGASLAIRAKLPGHYERPHEFVECTPLGYALRFPGTEGPNAATIELLREKGAA